MGAAGQPYPPPRLYTAARPPARRPRRPWPPGRRAAPAAPRGAPGSASSPPASNASWAVPTGSSASSTSAPIVVSTRRPSACAQTAPNRPVEAPITAAGLPRSGLVSYGRETQSSAFLSWPGQRAVVLRRRHQDRVGRGDRPPQLGHRDRRGAGLGVLVERGHLAQPVPDLQLDTGRQRGSSGAQERAVVGALAQAPVEAEDAHHACSAMSSSCTDSVTSLPRASPPRGSGSVPRHAVVAAVDHRGQLERGAQSPNGSSTGACQRPEATISRVTLRIVSRPRTSAEPSSPSDDRRRRRRDLGVRGGGEEVVAEEVLAEASGARTRCSRRARRPRATPSRSEPRTPDSVPRKVEIAHVAHREAQRGVVGVGEWP